MSWRARGNGLSTWRHCLAPLRQEAAAKGYVTRQNLQAALESLRAATAEVQDNELAEDLPFLVQQLLGRQPSVVSLLPVGSDRDISTHVALCRLMTSLTASRTVSLRGPAANLILSALRQWSDGVLDCSSRPPCTRLQSNFDIAKASVAGTTANSNTSDNRVSSSGDSVVAMDSFSSPAIPSLPPPPSASLHLEAMTALAALLPDHLGMLSEHERAAQFAALLSLLVPQSLQLRGAEGSWGRGTTEHLDMQCLALTALAACCGRIASGGGSSNNSGLTADETAALLSAAVSLLQSCAIRSRPVEDSAHSRMYAALVRVLQTAIGEARQAWVSRAALLVEGLQRFLTFGVQASLAAAAPSGVASASNAAPSPMDGSSGRYRPPHLRRRESQADGALTWSDSDVSDTEHGSGGTSVAAGSGAGSADVVDRFRSSRVRSAALTCIQAMAKSDPRAMHSHWSALLPLQNPLQPRPLTPHLITVLLYDPLSKVRTLAAATISSLLDGPAQRSILAVAEAKSMSARAPVRGFLTLSLSLGQLLLAAHVGLLHAVANESSALVLPGVLRALVVLMSASPYERLPRELLPETLKVVQIRWATLTAASSSGQGAAATSIAPGELGPIQTAYLACLAECFSTKHPIAGMAEFLGQEQEPQLKERYQRNEGVEARHEGTDSGSRGGSGGGNVAKHLIRDLLVVGRDASTAAVERVEALAALKGLAANYINTLPSDIWDDLRVTATMGLTCSTLPRTLHGTRSGPPSRCASSSSLAPIHGSPARPRDRTDPRVLVNHASGPRGFPGASTGSSAAQAAVTSVTSSANSSPEDKAAQLSVKLLSDYLSAIARHYNISRVDGGGSGHVDSCVPNPLASPGFVPLTAAMTRRQQPGLSPVSVRSEEERAAGLQKLVCMWQDTMEVLVPAATSHQSYMVRSAGLACLGEVLEPVFSSLTPHLHQQLLMLLSDAAALDSVPAVRAAACKALGAVAVFPAILEQPQLSDRVTGALMPCLRDTVLSVRIAAGWAVANLCDAYRRRLDASDAANREEGDTELEQKMLARRMESHTQASTSCGSEQTGAAQKLQLEPHHYRQLAALCSAAITATQDADKVRANGIRAVGNLMALLTPDMASALAVAGGRATADGSPMAVLDSPSKNAPFWKSAGNEPPPATSSDSWRSRPNGKSILNEPSKGTRIVSSVPSLHSSPAAGAEGSNTTSSAWGSSEGIQMDTWLDGALTCLQTTLTTGGMKVQWNACCAAHGLLCNPQLLAHPRVAARATSLLLLLVMLVRDSANFKIRTHAAAALAALPCREAYGDVLPDALLVVAGALESLASGGGGGGGATASAKAASAEADADGDGGEGRFPNYRYLVGLSEQLRATLLYLLGLAQPTDARRVREALIRRADFLYACLREQLAEAVQPLRALKAAAQGGDCVDNGRLGSGFDGRGSNGCADIRGTEIAGGVASEDRCNRVLVNVDLPADPFGLWGGRSQTNVGALATGGLAGLLEGLCLRDEQANYGNTVRESPGATEVPDPRSGDARGTRRADSVGFSDVVADRRPLRVQVEAGEEDKVLQRARGRVAAIAAPLRGFSNLLAQLGHSVEPALRDVQQVLALMQSS